MELKVINSLIFLHVLSGTGSVIGMFGALAANKGSLWHRRFGRLYTYSMSAALLLALIVSSITDNFFLFLIGIFSAYFVFTGWRLALVKDGTRSLLDKCLSVLMLGCAIAMVCYGINLRVSGESLGIALAVFGVFAFFPAWSDVRLSAWPKGKQRIVLHLNRMGGASIATMTAVFVVNVATNPAFIAWLLPTMVGSPLIIYWTRRTLSQDGLSQRK